MTSVVTVDPEPTRTHTHRDGFGNTVTAITLDEPHDHLAVTATSEVTLLARPDPGPLWRPPLGGGEGRHRRRYQRGGARCPAVPARLPRVERPDLRALGALAFAPGARWPRRRPALNTLVHGEFEFLPGATDVTTPSPRCSPSAAASARTSPTSSSAPCARWAWAPST